MGQSIKFSVIYRLIGKLIYLTVTRLDMSFVVGVLSQFMQSPQKAHWDPAVRILRYLKGVLRKGLVYRPNRHMELVAYSNADWAGLASARCSTTRYCTFVGGNLVTWRSKKETTITRSSVEAEYRAMVHTTAELMWVRSLLLEMGLPVSTLMKMYCDNQAATILLVTPSFMRGLNTLKWIVTLFKT
ncbi:uncharacterized mitochondrial protein AtMg00810-like [Telopea speciosissima]|uniref:uncharacterized mitochondrial protein AtMg00810-like n=1 Tax=Telopea speciosissima TaxID=54955 RepID=UPI001CC46355|nr:uncharacterized mitochondrial protein AtMg00810-like [Telopea speciosissima]